tara:strand:+ start:323 stop:1033 length:711 start_codon:yes stop_codon:yes gene_type:complete
MFVVSNKATFLINYIKGNKMQQAKKATPAVTTGKATQPTNPNAVAMLAANPASAVQKAVTRTCAWHGYLQATTKNVVSFCNANGGLQSYSLQPIAANLQLVNSYYLTHHGSSGNIINSTTGKIGSTCHVFTYPKSKLIPKALHGTTQTLLARGAMCLYAALGVPTLTGNNTFNYGTATNNLKAVMHFLTNGYVTHLGAKGQAAQYVLGLALTGCASPNQYGKGAPYVPFCKLVKNS